MLRLLGLAAVIALGGCGQTVSPEEKKQRDAADVAAVEAMQKIVPPIKPLALQAITLEEITAKNLSGAGCSFSTTTAAQPIVLALVGRAVIKQDDHIDLLISDNGGAKLEAGAWEHYVGKDNTLTLKRTPGDGTPGVAVSTQYAGELIVRDAWERIVYSARGTINCGA